MLPLMRCLSFSFCRTLHRTFIFAKPGVIRDSLLCPGPALRPCLLVPKLSKKFGYAPLLLGCWQCALWFVCLFRPDAPLCPFKVPDTFFANEKSAQFHMATTPNTFIRIKNTGEVFRSMRYVYGKLYPCTCLSRDLMTLHIILFCISSFCFQTYGHLKLPYEFTVLSNGPAELYY